EVQAGTWKDPDEADFPPAKSTLPPDPRYPASAQYDLVVRGNSMNRFAPDGHIIRCVDLSKVDETIQEGDVVIFARQREHGQLVETTAKRFRRRGSVIELMPDSTDERWQEPVRLDARKTGEGAEGRIVALVLYTYTVANERRR